MTYLIWLLTLVSQLSCSFASDIEDWDNDIDALLTPYIADQKKRRKEERTANLEILDEFVPQRRSSASRRSEISDSDDYSNSMHALMEPYDKVKREKIVSDDLINYVASMLRVDRTKFQQQQISLDKILEQHESIIGDKIQIILLTISGKLENQKNLSDSLLIDQYTRLLEDKIVELRNSAETIGMQIMEKFEALINEREYQKLENKNDYLAHKALTEKSKKEVHGFYYYIDGYFTSELLSLASSMLEIVTKNDLPKYKTNEILLKLQKKEILNPEIAVDTLESWRTKRQHLFALEHACLNVLEAHQKIDEVGIMKEDLKKRLQLPRVTFYLTSHDFLLNLYQERQNSLNLIETLNKTAIEFTSILSHLHHHYHVSHSNLLLVTNKYRQELLSAHNITMSTILGHYAAKAHSLFKDIIQAQESTDKMAEINSRFLIAIDHFWEDFRSKYPINESADLDKKRAATMEELYNNTIASLFLTILDDVEKRYQEARNPLTQALTSLGMRTSQTHEFFNAIVLSYQKNKPSLFDEKQPYAININARIKKLETTMTEVDNKGYNEAYNAISEKVSYLNPFGYSVVNSVVGNPLSSWWSTPTDTNQGSKGRK